jgi:hypothetical protein
VIDSGKTRSADVVAWHKLAQFRFYELTPWKWLDGDPAK